MNTTCPNCGKEVPASNLHGLCPECMLKAGVPTHEGTQSAVGPHGTKIVPPPPPKPEEIAARFPQLEIVEYLGRGGMGAVYKARQPRLNRFVALKILAPEKEMDPQFAERFTREAQALARLNHPNIVTVYDFGEADGLFYLLMEYVDGANLRQLIGTGKLAPEEAMQLVPRICEALQYAHEQGLVHRDIKPENLLVDGKGRVKIADFGIAKIIGRQQQEAALTGAQEIVGTPHYMAPEQVEKPQAVDHRADIYSLGVVFYEMLTGELPLGKFAPPSRKVEVDVRLDQVVLRALEKEPERRYQQAHQVKSDVETIAGTPGGAEPPVAPSPIGANTTISQQVRGPGIGLIATGVLNWISIPAIAVIALAAKSSFMLLVPIAIMLLSTLMILGGLKLKRLESYPVAILGSILAVLVTPGNLVGLPLGIWALAVLTRSDIRAAFNAHKRGLPVGTDCTQSSRLGTGSTWQQVKGPGIGLIVTGTLNWILIPVIASIALATKSSVMLLVPLSIMVSSSIMIWAGHKLKQLESYSVAVTGSILAMVIIPGNLVGLPIGIWCLVVLARREVRAAFTAQRSGVSLPQTQERPSGGNTWKLFAITAAVFLLVAPLGAVLMPVVLRAINAAERGRTVVQGTVTDAVTRKPIVGARVADDGYRATRGAPGRETWTDNVGRYQLLTWPEEHNVVVSAPGYEPKLEWFEGARGRSSNILDFQLRPIAEPGLSNPQ